MALTKAKKEQVLDEVSKILDESKLTVFAKYDGTSVQQMQELRRHAKNNATKVKVFKNRLVIRAISSNDKFKRADTSQLTSQLLYAFSSEDEVAPAKSLAEFAKKNPSIRFVGAFNDAGQFIEADEVKALASLPSKAELIASVVNTLNLPLSDILSGTTNGIANILNSLEAKASSA
jgi:large subunit ribosomal protein L10